MPDIFDDVVEELHQTLATLWPETVAPTGSQWVRGIYNSEQIERTLPLDRIVPPYAVIEIQDWRQGEWSPDRLSWEPEVNFWYFDKTGGQVGPIRDKLHALARYLAPLALNGQASLDPLKSSQLISIGDISTSDQLPANQILTQAKSPVIGGRLTVQLFTEDSS